jgi:hypothetical protein
MNKVPILFTSKTCGACKNQLDLISKHFKGKSNTFINIIDVDKHNIPFIQYTPTWYIPNKNGGYSVYDSVINNPKDFDKLVSKGSAFGKKTRKTRFGNDDSYLPQLGTWEKYGKNFPNGKGFNIPSSFSNEIEKTWGTGKDALNSGLLGRDQGPGNFNNVLSNQYVNGIRMAQPGGQLETALNLNRNCNQKVSTESPGLIFNSPNPQIVPMSFGKRSKFGNSYLYAQMGKAYSSQYIKDPDTVKKLYGGALTDNLPRPDKVQNKNIFIGQAPPYNPLNKFGKKAKKAKKVKVKTKVCLIKKVPKKCVKNKCIKKSIKKCTIGEGSVLTIKGNKIKVKKVKKKV